MFTVSGKCGRLAGPRWFATMTAMRKEDRASDQLHGRLRGGPDAFCNPVAIALPRRTIAPIADKLPRGGK
jgi:hypothetical protein